MMLKSKWPCPTTVKSEIVASFLLISMRFMQLGENLIIEFENLVCFMKERENKEATFVVP